MPYRAPRICACGKIVSPNVICLCQQRRKAEADKRRPSATARGYDGKWRKAREDFLKLHPTCAMCGAPATVVDHREPHRGDMALFWKRSNWQPLCTIHHNSTKQSLERQANRIT
jgi:5-methylcytosine-specific restriction protein A